MGLKRVDSAMNTAYRNDLLDGSGGWATVILATCRYVRQLTVILIVLAYPAVFGQQLSFEKGLLWRIQPPDSPPSYIFATVHSEDPRILDLPESVRQHLSTADAVILEALPDQSSIAQSLQFMLFQDDTRLSTLLDSAAYRQVVNAMRRHAYPSHVVETMKPWAVAVTLSVPPLKTGVFLDLFLMLEAQRFGIPIHGLETIQEQLSLLDSFSLDEQLLMLHDTLKLLPQFDNYYHSLLDAYLQRDLAALNRLGYQFMGDNHQQYMTKFNKLVIEDRNYKMVARMQPHLQQGNAFIAVGALHLPGDKGILTLLSQQGCNVSRVY